MQLIIGQRWNKLLSQKYLYIYIVNEPRRKGTILLLFFEVLKQKFLIAIVSSSYEKYLYQMNIKLTETHTFEIKEFIQILTT